MAKKKEEKQGVDLILAELEKKYGMERVSPNELTIVNTGSLQLNEAMGTGGTALGKIVEIFGPESSGKSTIVLHQIAEYQKAFPEKRAALFDYEHSFDKKYARALGVDVDKLLIYQPETQEEGYDMILALIEKDITSCIVIDSQSAATPKAVLQGEMGDATIGLQARINSKFCMKVKGMLDIHNCTLFIISQLRDAIGSMGEPTTTTGGKAIKYYADVRWKVWKINDKINELNKTTVDVIKNKLASPFGQAKINIIWGHGFDKLGEIIDYAVEFDFIKKGGAGWFTYTHLLGDFQESIKLQGMDKMKDYLEENYEELEELERLVINSLKGVVEEEDVAPTPEIEPVVTITDLANEY
jgi:recombination protein RecA